MKSPRADTRPLIERLPLDRLAWPIRLGWTVAIIAVMFLVRLSASPWILTRFPLTAFTPAVIVVAFVFGARMATIAMVICGVLARYVFMEPLYAFTLTSSSAIALIFFALTAGVAIVLVHWMQTANRALTVERETSERLAATRELLFRELQHRVSNNLQVVAGLLALQKRRVHDTDARAALDESARRLTVIGRISRQLYDPSGESRDLAGFLERLAEDVIDASGRGDLICAVSCDGGMTLAPDHAVPLALIVAEAVANAIEHGLSDRTGRIDIVVARSDTQMLSIEVRDDGGALPADFTMAGQDSLGLSIATMLARQIGGVFTLHGGETTVARLSLPEKASAAMVSR
ncbi:sensor histidine kinase [Sphingomonas bacterium]|uniref:sensor histidine kinase n=1 Tax=Sphingomonas bacterium TaxID=1895847 RepID=UPI00157777A7|nr:histidine kinase dimerization/phosphoacceptor domain -containing protein [Sphingomonas bacterium]